MDSHKVNRSSLIKAFNLVSKAMGENVDLQLWHPVNSLSAYPFKRRDAYQIILMNSPSFRRECENVEDKAYFHLIHELI
jgi:hypothetical protein